MRPVFMQMRGGRDPKVRAAGDSKTFLLLYRNSSALNNYVIKLAYLMLKTFLFWFWFTFIYS